MWLLFRQFHRAPKLERDLVEKIKIATCSNNYLVRNTHLPIHIQSNKTRHTGGDNIHRHRTEDYQHYNQQLMVFVGSTLQLFDCSIRSQSTERQPLGIRGDIYLAIFRT